MLDKSYVSIEIGKWYIKILAGNKKAVKSFDVIKTPEECFDGDNITNVKKLAKAISDSLSRNRIGYKNVSFVVQGQDIVIRHMETPMLDKKGIWKALNWEVSQYLPNGGKDYYFDYEITETINTADKKIHKLMVVSVPKSKVEKYMQLADKLKLKLSAIDITFNSIGRVFRNLHIKQKENEAVGIINLGIQSSSLTILEKGNLIMEREVPFGLCDAAGVMYSLGSGVTDKEIGRFLGEFRFNAGREDYTKINYLFDDVFSVLEKVIQFYTSAKAKKYLGKIFLVGEGADIGGIDNYINNYFSTPVEIMNSTDDIGLSIKYPKNMVPKYFVNNLGLLQRKE